MGWRENWEVWNTYNLLALILLLIPMFDTLCSSFSFMNDFKSFAGADSVIDSFVWYTLLYFFIHENDFKPMSHKSLALLCHFFLLSLAWLPSSFCNQYVVDTTCYWVSYHIVCNTKQSILSISPAMSAQFRSSKRRTTNATGLGIGQVLHNAANALSPSNSYNDDTHRPQHRRFCS